MTARDYQHHGYQAQDPLVAKAKSGTPTRSSKQEVASPSSMMAVESVTAHARPRIVTPNRESNDLLPRNINFAAENHEPAAMLHQPTASNQGLTMNSPMRVNENLRYSLKEGMEKPFSSNGSIGSIGSTSNHSKSKSRRHGRSSGRSSKNGTGGKVRKQDPNSYKIFLLLLQPKSKIFELIQLIYAPNDTTVGDIIKMIPDNATEQALGGQEYIGLCRPKTHEELFEMDILASECRPGIMSAKITLGEILVAIPEGYSGPDVAGLSKQILANPKIVKLLKRADPLAPKRRRSSRRSHRDPSRRKRSKERVHILEKHDETDEEYLPSNSVNKKEAERQMRAAMKHAAAEAAAANAAIPGGGSKLKIELRYNHDATKEGEESSLDLSAQESLDESYSSWSKSFDASFSAQSSICSGVNRRAQRRRERQAKRMKILRRSAVVAFGLMVLLYALDPRKPKEVLIAQNELHAQSPMGIMGIFQCLFLLLTLYKVERLIRTTTEINNQKTKAGSNEAIYMSEERKCPFLKASARALKRFKNKYSKRLKRNLVSGVPGNTDDTSFQGWRKGGRRTRDEDSYSQHKLRSFSLKAAAIQDLDTDTGSL